MGEVIVITSGKGGVGKTTTTANIGAGLSKLGKKVVIIDTDLGLRNLDVVMGMENLVVYNLVDVVEGNCRLKQAMIADKRCPNLFLLPTAQTRDKSAVTPEQMIKVIDEINLKLAQWACEIEIRFKNKADIFSPSFAGTPTTTLPLMTDNSNRIASTEWVNAKIAAASIDDNVKAISLDPEYMCYGDEPTDVKVTWEYHKDVIEHIFLGYRRNRGKACTLLYSHAR